MIRTLRFRREEADTWIAKAREDLTVVNTTDAAIPFAPRAHSAQAATEKALKAPRRVGRAAARFAPIRSAGTRPSARRRR